MPRKRGRAILMGVTARASLYTIMAKTAIPMVYSSFAALLGLDAPEEDEEKLALLSARSVMGTAAYMALRGSRGNLYGALVAMGMEQINKNYLQALRGGDEYDYFDHSLAFSPVADKDLVGDDIYKVGFRVAFPSAAPVAATVARGTELRSRMANRQTSEARDKAAKEFYTRIPLEIAGNLGYVPLYGDVRRIILNHLFADDSTDNETTGTSTGLGGTGY